jgi:hypothetical protein
MAGMTFPNLEIDFTFKVCTNSATQLTNPMSSDGFMIPFFSNVYESCSKQEIQFSGFFSHNRGASN